MYSPFFNDITPSDDIVPEVAEVVVTHYHTFCCSC